jgi:uncharacterized protein YkwD
MRGSVLLAVGLLMMAGALCFAVVAVGMVRDRGPGRVIAPPVNPDPVEPEPVKPVEGQGDSSEDYNRPTLDIPDEPAPKVVTPQRSNEAQGNSRTPTNTTTLVAVRTCEGGSLKLNVSEQRMFVLHNRTRAKKRLRLLCVSPYLTQLARSRSQDMISRDYFSHYAPPDGTTASDQVVQSGNPLKYTWVGENISLGGSGLHSDTPEHMFDGLMHSPGHRRNILRKQYDQIGVGAVSGSYKEYDDTTTIYTMVFGGR